MEKSDAIAALAALAQDNRLDIFRLLVSVGRDGLAAGEIGDRLQVAPATLSFHLAQLRQAGLIAMKRDGRSLIYSADYAGMNELMNFLTENCCVGPDTCRVPVCDPATARIVPSKPRKRLDASPNSRRPRP